jgi:hypothetical protein
LLGLPYLKKSDFKLLIKRRNGSLDENKIVKITATNVTDNVLQYSQEKGDVKYESDLPKIKSQSHNQRTVNVAESNNLLPKPHKSNIRPIWMYSKAYIYVIAIFACILLFSVGIFAMSLGFIIIAESFTYIFFLVCISMLWKWITGSLKRNVNTAADQTTDVTNAVPQCPHTKDNAKVESLHIYNYYDILQIRQDASDDEIEDAYYDRTLNAKTRKEERIIQTAYEILSDEKERKRHDKYLKPDNTTKPVYL